MAWTKIGTFSIHGQLIFCVDFVQCSLDAMVHRRILFQKKKLPLACARAIYSMQSDSTDPSDVGAPIMLIL